MPANCPDCNGQVSDQADHCPHCRHPLKNAAIPQRKQEGAAPVFLLLAAMAFVLLLFTPPFLLLMPLLAALGGAAVSLMRRESGMVGAVLIILATLGLFGATEGSTTPSTHASSAVGRSHAGAHTD